MPKGDSAIIEKEVYTRKQGQQRNQLVKRIEALGMHDGKFVHKDGFNQFINETAFTWFNRLTAIRYMEVNEYLDHGFRVLSKAEGAQFSEGFEILNSAADVADDLGLNKEQIIDMVLDGNKEEELYRTILLGQCHQLSEAMSFMFEKLDDATELLLPDNLTKTDSILKDLVNDIPEDNWQEIEVIGWLYQFYISEHKDAVIGKVVKREDIPAATQLFTPNWIVKYLVQNSLGRQWLATYPDSELKEKMEYYITPAEQSDDVIEQLKAITPTSIDPEEIKVLDPACGSGHILVEVYEVLREIYLERGYRLREIPELILTKNIYGLDIDDRAAQMAAFAVLMKAREDDKRIFTRDIKLNIHSIQSTENLNINQLWADLDLDGSKQTGSMGDLFAEPPQELVEPTQESKVYLDLLYYLKEQFIDAKNLGSLIKVKNQHLESLTKIKEQIANKIQDNEPTAKNAAGMLLPVIEQAIVLATKYDVVAANPPYIGSKGMNTSLKDFAKNNHPDAKSDLFAMYIERCISYGNKNAQIGMVTPYVWMFLGSYEQLRENLLHNHTLTSLIQLEYNAFEPACIPVCTFTISKGHLSNSKGSYIRLSDFKGHKSQPIKTLEAIRDPQCNWFYETSSILYNKIPGNPIAYWLEPEYFQLFDSHKQVGSAADSKQGLATADNEQFLRRWHEIDLSRSNINDITHINKKWIKHNKGGSFRRWYGNNEWLVNWENEGQQVKAFGIEKNGKPRSRVQNSHFYFRPGLTWSDLTSSYFASRKVEDGFIFDITGPSLFSKNTTCSNDFLLAYTNSSLFQQLLNVSLQGMHYSNGVIASMPVFEEPASWPKTTLQSLVNIYREDWNSYEQSYEFSRPGLICETEQTLKQCAQKTIKKMNETVLIAHKYESEINTFFSQLSGISDLQIEPDLKNITLFANPQNVYPKSEIDNSEYKQLADLVKNLTSYTIGCAMGRYSLDREGIVYANSDNKGFKELVAKNAYNSFPADDDGIVPLADEDWIFEDDATARFREFVKTVWGDEHLQENLDFIAESLCLDAIKAKKGESSIDTIRRYFSMQFYKDHLKTYKKRPIYWLFSSGKAKAFECLVYLHRYNEGTLSRMRTEYVTPLMGKLESRKNILNDSKATASGAEQRAIDKELKNIDKKQAELVKFDEELKHLAEMKISLDLDDGVKVNYGKFGNLLADVKAIHGKNPEAIK